jgi:ligand of Numb protein X 3/4
MMVQQKLFQQQLARQARQQKELAKKQQRKDNTESSASKNISQDNNSKQGQNSMSKSKSLSKQQSQTSSANSNLQSHNTLEANQTPPANASSGSDNGNVQMEWVVKLRPDGTRYIARRPIRSKIMKERAKRLAQERCGMTTDDDNMSELKLGRYCRKEDRKRHLEKAKEYKKKKEQLMKQKLESLKENNETKEPNIIDLSHKKMMKHKHRKLLDDFVTIQEMLVHGSRVETATKVPNPLLSVTTV